MSNKFPNNANGLTVVYSPFYGVNFGDGSKAVHIASEDLRSMFPFDNTANALDADLPVTVRTKLLVNDGGIEREVYVSETVQQVRAFYNIEQTAS